MARKQKNRGIISDNLPTVRIGSRVRCTDDGVLGRIVWANALSVNVHCHDAHHITWKLHSLPASPPGPEKPRPVDGAHPGGRAPPAAGERQPQAEPTASTELTPEAPTTMPVGIEPTAAELEPPATEPVASEPIPLTPEPATTE